MSVDASADGSVNAPATTAAVTTGTPHRARFESARRVAMRPLCRGVGCGDAERPVRSGLTARGRAAAAMLVGMRILVVDDEVVMTRALRRGLAAEGFAVDVAHDGRTGLDLARDGAYDAIVLDIMLPGLSGYDVLQTLRAEEVWTPVLLLSAKDGDHDVADGLDVGADDYLTKPFAFVVLVARLRALLRRGAVPRPVVLTVGDVASTPRATS